ncbi:MAG: thioester reductase domain-containing protein [Cellulomonas sp.]|uniref:thioester reductase domain-containing protein n=1 Tax=Cellulomonas sp. TaxID=40001 RepID=UPI0019E3698C|nr:thioester reductase domain-containing protein [Cellulomonas sp.]MBF0688240.1 thioester reductase domain-containing protein [Cellulomonas sp.]
MTDVEDIYELPALARGMLVHGLRAPQDGAYVEQTVLRLVGPLDTGSFWRAWQLVVDRHPSLRTGVHWRGVRVPVQVVARTARLPREEHDWRAAGAATAEERLRALLDDERRRGFDLERPPLVRVALVRVAADEHVVALRMSHLVVDGWSVGVLCGEFAAAYRALAAGRAPVLAPAPPVRPWVERAARAATAEAVAAWRRSLARFEPAPPVQASDAGPVDGLPQGFVEDAPEPWTRALDAASRRHRVSRHSVVQAAWSLVLARACGRDDVVAGTTFAHRPADVSGVEGVVGCLLATAPVRVRVHASDAVGDWLTAVQGTVQEVRGLLDVPLDVVQEAAGTPPGRELVETLVEYMNVPLPAVDLGDGGPRVVGLAMDSRPHVPLSLLVPPVGLPVRLVHDVRRVGPASARALLDATSRVVAAISAGVASVGELVVAAGAVPDLTTPVPAPRATPEDPDAALPPRAGTEEQVAAVLAALLEVAGPIGRGVDLVDLGMHSLLGTRAVNALARELGADVPLRVLFERPTVAAIAAEVDRGRAGAPADARPAAAPTDLRAHVRLDEAVVPTGAVHPDAGLRGEVLLTGVTGTVGSALLVELLRSTPARVLCLVRDPRRATERIEEVLRAAGLDGSAERVELVVGNLARPGLGLAPDDLDRVVARVGDVVHAGASVNFLPPYRRLAPVNVDAVVEVLRIAARGGARVHHVSSTAVHGRWPVGPAHRAEGRLSPDPTDLENGYEQTKWVAEQVVGLAHDRGIPVTVYRLGRMAGDRHTGRWKLGDVLSQTLRACVAVRAVPDAAGEIDLVPADVAAAAVVRAASDPGSVGRWITVAARRRFCFPVFVEALAGLDVPVETLPLDVWASRLRELAAQEVGSTWPMVLAVLEPWLLDVAAGRQEPTYATAESARWAGPDAAGVPVDAELVARYVRHMADVGFVERVPVVVP